MAGSSNGNNGNNRYPTSPISSDDDSEAALFAPLHRLTAPRRRAVAPFAGVARRRPPVALMSTGGVQRPAAASTPIQPTTVETVQPTTVETAQPQQQPAPVAAAVGGPSLEQLRELFICGVCREYEPVRGYGSQCENTHRVCRPCALSIRDEALSNPYGGGDRCPLCRGAWRFTFTSGDNTAFMDRLAALVPFGCLNVGCTFTATPELLRQHQASCAWQPIKCPVVHCRAHHAAITMADGHLLRDHRLQEFEPPQRLELQCLSVYGEEDIEQADNREEASWCFLIAIKSLTAGAPTQKLLVQCVADKLGGVLYVAAHNLVSGLAVDRHISVNVGAAHLGPVNRVLRNFNIEHTEISAKDRVSNCLILPYTAELNMLSQFKQSAGLTERYFELTLGLEYAHTNFDLAMVNQPAAVRLRPLTQNRVVRRRRADSELDADYEPPAQVAITAAAADTTHISITYSDE